MSGNTTDNIKQNRQRKLRLDNADDAQIKRSLSLTTFEDKKISGNNTAELDNLSLNRLFAAPGELQKIEPGSSNITDKAKEEDLRIEQRMQAMSLEVNKYIYDNYPELYEEKLEETGYVEPEGFAQKLKSLAEKNAKSRSFEKKSGSRDFAAIGKLQDKLRNENNPIIQLQLKEEIILQRNKGLKSIAKLSSDDFIESREKTADVSVSEQMELGALYKAELAKLDEEKGDALDYSPAKREYAALLIEKIKETKERIKKREQRRKDVNLASKLQAAYASGKSEYKAECEKIEQSLYDNTVDKVAIIKMCEDDAKKFGDKKLEMKAVKDEKNGKVTYEDSIKDKYSTLLSMDFISIQHFEATFPKFVQMGKDIRFISSEKSADYKKHDANIIDLEKKKSALSSDSQMKEEDKKAQMEKMDEEITKEKRAMLIIEQEMNQLLKYDFFRKRIIKLHKFFTNRAVTNIWFDKLTVFRQGEINFKNYDYSMVGKIRLAKKMDILLLGKTRSEAYYDELLYKDNVWLNEEDKKDIKHKEAPTEAGKEDTKKKSKPKGKKKPDKVAPKEEVKAQEAPKTEVKAQEAPKEEKKVEEAPQEAPKEEKKPADAPAIGDDK